MGQLSTEGGSKSMGGKCRARGRKSRRPSHIKYNNKGTCEWNRAARIAKHMIKGNQPDYLLKQPGLAVKEKQGLIEKVHTLLNRKHFAFVKK